MVYWIDEQKQRSGPWTIILLGKNVVCSPQHSNWAISPKKQRGNSYKVLKSTPSWIRSRHLTIHHHQKTDYLWYRNQDMTRASNNLGNIRFPLSSLFTNQIVFPFENWPFQKSSTVGSIHIPMHSHPIHLTRPHPTLHGPHFNIDIMIVQYWLAVSGCFLILQCRRRWWRRRYSGGPACRVVDSGGVRYAIYLTNGSTTRKKTSKKGWWKILKNIWGKK